MEKHHNYHNLQFESFHFSYIDIIIYHGKHISYFKNELIIHPITMEANLGYGIYLVLY